MDIISRATYEIVGERFEYRGWNIRGDHMPEKETPQDIIFGESGVRLYFVDGKARLDIPAGIRAELIQSDYAYLNGNRVEGNFVEVLIYNSSVHQIH